MKLQLTGLLLFGIISISFSQRVENIKAVYLDDKIVVTYDLIATEAQQKFDIDLYSSVNKYAQPLKSVTGDVGKGLTAAKNKRIEWNIKSELGQYQGDIIFEVRANVLVASTSPTTSSSGFVIPSEGAMLRRGKVYKLQWTGISQSQLDLELHRSGVKQNTIGKSAGANYSWTVPETAKPGSDYQIKLITGGSNQIAISKTFKIGRKIPLGLKIAPVIVIGALVPVLLGGGTDPPPPDPDPLPEPPLPE